MFEKMKNIIESRDGMDRFTRGYEDYGVMVTPDGGVRCREWAPNARALFLQGEFSELIPVSRIQKPVPSWCLL